MRNNYNCISALNITKAIVLAFFIVLPSLLTAQQAPSIRTDVTFQWEENSQPNRDDPATIKSVTIGGVIYNTFVVPTTYDMTRLGPDGHSPNRIYKNGNYVGGNSSTGAWNGNALDAFQDKNLNHYFVANPNGQNICNNFNAIASTNAQKQTIFYDPAIPANSDGVLAVTERGGNNCFYVEIWGVPLGGGSEQKLGETFVRNNGDYRNCTFGAPINNSTDYWRSGRCNENGQTIGIGLFYLDDIVPTGSQITKIEFVAATRDHGDGKFFILQKYAVDHQSINCIGTSYSCDLSMTNNAPDNSTYTLTSPLPKPANLDFNSDGTYTYTPDTSFVGDFVFEYELCLTAPNQSVCDQAKVTLSFVDLPPDPTIDIDCDPNSDNFIISVTNPLDPEYEYALIKAPNTTKSYQDSPDFDNLTEGSYSLFIRSKLSQCETPFFMNAIILSNLELTGSITDVACRTCLLYTSDAADDVSTV